jgi:hypothetical protein
MGDLVAQVRSMGNHGHESAGRNDEGPRREEIRWGYTVLRSGLKFGSLKHNFFFFFWLGILTLITRIFGFSFVWLA